MMRIFGCVFCLFVVVVCVLRWWWVRLAGHPDTKTGSKSQHCQAWCAKVGTTFPFGSAFQLSVCVCVRGVYVNDRWGNGVLFFVFFMDVPS